jgi:hypothetical protein
MQLFGCGLFLLLLRLRVTAGNSLRQTHLLEVEHNAIQQLVHVI